MSEALNAEPLTPAPHALAQGVLLAIRIDHAVNTWVDDDTARSLGEAIADELATPAGRERVTAFYAELDGGGQ